MIDQGKHRVNLGSHGKHPKNITGFVACQCVFRPSAFVRTSFSKITTRGEGFECCLFYIKEVK